MIAFLRKFRYIRKIFLKISHTLKLQKPRASFLVHMYCTRSRLKGHAWSPHIIRLFFSPTLSEMLKNETYVQCTFSALNLFEDIGA